MNRKYVLIGVEGPHDQAFVSRILCKLLGFSKFDGTASNLDDFWRKAKIPPNYPRGGNLYARLDMPEILYNDNFSIAIYVGNGSQLISNLRDKLADIGDISTLFAFAIVADTDNNTPDKVVKEYHKGFKEYFSHFPTEVTESGNVTEGSPELETKAGIYILPDNSQTGVLDSLICDCGELVYPEYMQRAKEYIDKFSEEERKKKLKWKPFDQQKAIIATVASVLQPGATNTVTIKCDDWISIETAEIPAIKNFAEFLRNLLKLET
ncbi:hypothetical protein PN450_11995 [Dolichospermum lemmermannii CS-548]|uniref:DUF3226 domain-containing protein n=1 Tax=Dolichospermum lemmermannii TaxID=54295 RepID=UPI00232F480C|nr:DUF3226 domain-containing protein [Dolichospermum lemmermannii]MDB9437498.1 hypothetical protein [Dolichospermum lemmermannii CS-548]